MPRIALCNDDGKLYYLNGICSIHVSNYCKLFCSSVAQYLIIVQTCISYNSRFRQQLRGNLFSKAEVVEREPITLIKLVLELYPVQAQRVQEALHAVHAKKYSKCDSAQEKETNEHLC